jgi:hypothetical protein
MDTKIVGFVNGRDFAVVQRHDEYDLFEITLSIGEHLVKIPIDSTNWQALASTVSGMIRHDTVYDLRTEGRA